MPVFAVYTSTTAFSHCDISSTAFAVPFDPGGGKFKALEKPSPAPRPRLPRRMPHLPGVQTQLGQHVWVLRVLAGNRKATLPSPRRSLE
jgi:hypothetical protein